MRGLTAAEIRAKFVAYEPDSEPLFPAFLKKYARSRVLVCGASIIRGRWGSLLTFAVA